MGKKRDKPPCCVKGHRQGIVRAMHVEPVKTAVFQEGEDLVAFIVKHVPRPKGGSILCVASKIVALAEGRVVEAANTKEKEQLIQSESQWQRKVLPQWWLTVRDGTVVVNAGIDESNADGKLVLLPQDSFRSAATLRTKLKKIYRIKNLGIIITDSRITALRAGVVGVALGYAGFRGVRDYRGTTDIFGRMMEVTQTDIADSLATAATLVMGEGKEQQPLAVITDAPVQFSERVQRNELRIPMKDDLYKDLFRTEPRKKRR